MAADVQVNRLAETLVELRGGSGSQAWKLRYGTQIHFKLLVVPAGSDRAWFSHAGWLRLLDTSKGVVVGRWRFPGQIVSLVPAGNRVQLEVEEIESGRSFRRTLTFDPQAPEVPFWPATQADLYFVSLDEARAALYPAVNEGLTSAFATLSLGKITADRARQLVPDVEESVRRDPLSPWLHFALGKVLRDSGDPRAQQAFAEIASVPTADFTELLIIASNLQEIGKFDVAREVFERGYSDFLRRGNDPRLLLSMRSRLLLAVFPRVLPAKEMPEAIEHLYWLSPGAVGMQQALLLYVDYLKEKGNLTEANKWRARAEELRTATPLPLLLETTRPADQALFIIVAAILAVLLYVVVLYLRYRPQRKLDLAARDRPRSFSFFHIQYWSRRERVALLIIVLAGWYAAGLAGGVLSTVAGNRRRPLSVTSGSFAGPAAMWYFESKMPPSLERDLCLAFAYQQSGENEKAERLYRQLPDFAESWNNLGVILRGAGRDPEARKAFEHALQLEPTMQEAAWNLGQAPKGLWAELHQKYVPEHPMVAPPQRSRLARLFYGPSTSEIYWRALAGVHAGPSLSMLFGGEELPGRTIEVLLFTLVLVFAFVIVFLLPQWDVTQPAGKIQAVWEALLPGTASAWSVLGGIALLLWAYIPLLLLTGNPILVGGYFPSSSAINLALSHGVPFPGSIISSRPSFLWIYVAAGLFAANLILIWRARHRAA